MQSTPGVTAALSYVVVSGMRSALVLNLALLATAGLYSCSVPWTPSRTRSYLPDNSWPTIVCFGDSLTEGVAAPQSQSYPAWLQRKLLASGYHYRVINAGVSGNRVTDALARLQTDVLSFHPKVVVVELGSNDVGRTSVTIWESQLAVLVARIQQHRTAVILGGLDEPGLNSVYRAVAARRDVPVVWFTSNLWSRPGLWGDPHHPNGRGYRVVMETFWPVLEQFLRARTH